MAGLAKQEIKKDEKSSASSSKTAPSKGVRVDIDEMGMYLLNVISIEIISKSLFFLKMTKKVTTHLWKKIQHLESLKKTLVMS